MISSDKSSQSFLPEQRRDFRGLGRAITQGELSPETLHQLSAQTIYLALTAVGLESVPEVLQELSPEQYQLILDFEFWNRDQFLEDHFWNLLRVIDQDTSHELLQQFLARIDVQLLMLVLNQYTRAYFPEERTDQPPTANCYTPDGGYTWVSIVELSPDRHRLLGRVLAILFETDAPKFYQLVGDLGSATGAELEEDAYAAKTRRLTDAGFPNQETAWKLNTPLSPELLRADYADKIKIVAPLSGREDLRPMLHPAIFEGRELQPLSEFIEKIFADNASTEQFVTELSLLLNAAMSFYSVNFSDADEMHLLIEKVKGAINIGLEGMAEFGPHSSAEYFTQFGLGVFYRLGLYYLAELRKVALHDSAAGSASDGASLALVQGATQLFPVVPEFFRVDADWANQQGKLEPNFRAFAHRREIDAVKIYLAGSNA